MPKVHINDVVKSYKAEAYCPHCGSDEMWFNPDTRLLECEWCEKLPTDDAINSITKGRKGKKVIKKMKKYE
jgi:hypothetical protein